MLQKILPLLFLACLLSSCKEGPKVTVCVSDPLRGGLQCFNQQTQTSSFVKYQDSDKYVAMPPSDAQTVFNFCAQGKGN